LNTVRSGLRKIVSGGQTGADRAALDAALAQDFPCGGWCPSGRQADDGPIPACYPLQALHGGYRARTLANVKHSDATVIFYRSAISGGTASTLKFCKQYSRRYLLIDSQAFDIEGAAATIRQFIEANRIATLNIAGPRASGCPSIYAYVKSVVERVIVACGKSAAIEQN
jgi:hypothetical protein